MTASHPVEAMVKNNDKKSGETHSRKKKNDNMSHMKSKTQPIVPHISRSHSPEVREKD